MHLHEQNELYLYHTYVTTNWSTAIGYNYIEKYHTATRACTVFKMFFKIFHLYKKVSKQKGAMLDGTKTPKRRQNHGSCSTTRWLSLHGWVHGRSLDTFCQEELATAARDVECTTLGPRQLLSICRSRLVAQLALSRLQNPA